MSLPTLRSLALPTLRSLALLLLLPLTLAAACVADDKPVAEMPDAAPPDATAPDAAPNPLLVERPYQHNVPDGYDPATPTPLLLLLHGYGAAGALQAAYFGIDAHARAHGVLLAFPDGTENAMGDRFWNATDVCCGQGPDDVAYLSAVLDDMELHYNVDPKRIYVVGHSNGGFMAYRLACDVGHRIAGIVSLAGAMWKDPARCPAESDVAVLQVHGDLDTTIEYGGTAFYPSAAQSVAFWAEQNGCGAALTDGGRLDIEGGLAGEETRIERHACTSGAAELWTIEGGGHVPSFGPGWSPALLDFLSAHPRP